MRKLFTALALAASLLVAPALARGPKPARSVPSQADYNALNARYNCALPLFTPAQASQKKTFMRWHDKFVLAYNSHNSFFFGVFKSDIEKTITTLGFPC